MPLTRKKRSSTIASSMPSQEPTMAMLRKARKEAMKAESQKELESVPAVAKSFHDVVARGSLVAVKRELSNGAPIDLQDSNGNTPLCIAAIKGHYNIAEYLFKNCGADPTSKGEGGRTPLHQAVFHCKQTIAAVFLPMVDGIETARTFINIKDDNGDTPLHTAISLKQNVFIEQLLRCGAEVSLQNEDGKSAFLSGDRAQQNFIAKICNQEKNRLVRDIAGHSTCIADKETLFETIREGNAELLDVTISCITEVNRAGQSMLFAAVQYQHEDVVRLLLKKKANVHVGCQTSNMSPIHIAAMSPNTKILQMLIKEGAKVNSKNNQENTPLHLAAAWKKVKNVSFLLDAKADPSQGNLKGRTPLHEAAVYGRHGVLKILLEHSKKQVEQVDKDGNTALHVASLWDWPKSIDALITIGGANKESIGMDGLHPLHVAARWNKTRGLKALLELQADPLAMDPNGFTANHIALKHGWPQVVEVVSPFLPEVKEVDTTEEDEKKYQKLRRAILKAISSKSLENLEDLLDINTCPKLIIEALFAATRTGCEEIVEFLINDYVVEEDLPAMRNEKNQSLLHVSIIARSSDFVENFLCSELSPNDQDVHGNTPLHIALAKSTTPVSVIEVLCNADDIDFSVVNEEGNSPLHVLFSMPSSDSIMGPRLAAMLSKLSAEHVNQQNSAGATALLLGISSFDVPQSIVDKLLDYPGIDVTIPYNEQSAIEIAVKRNLAPLARKLVLCGAVISDQDSLFSGAQKRVINEILEALEERDSKDKGGHQNDVDVAQLFMDLFEAGDTDGVLSWIEGGGNVHTKDEYSSIPLHIASLNGHTEIVKALIEANSDINGSDDNLQTPLHLAAMKGHVDVVTLLLDNQGDPNMFDAEDQCPLDWATMLGHDAIIDMLVPITN